MKRWSRSNPNVCRRLLSLNVQPPTPNPIPTDQLDSFPSLVGRAIVLTGPTASGKSSVAVELAERIEAEIISLDSIAVYREMDIGTAKPDDEQQSRVPHHLIDRVDPNQQFSVACYLQAAHAAVEDIEGRGRRVIFAGGTPMYLKGILRGFDPGPPADWEFRQAVERDVEKHGLAALWQRLQQVDPLAAHRIDPSDMRRMIRALEVAHLTGQPISHRQTQFDRRYDAEQCNVFHFSWNRTTLHQRIDRRVDQMFATGLVDEVKQLLKRWGSLSRTASQAVGYREVLQHLEDETDLTQTVDEVAAHTRQLARRQETWFRSFHEIRSIQLDEPLDPAAIAERIASELL